MLVLCFFVFKRILADVSYTNEFIKGLTDLDDLIEIMQRYGAYNAANLDGGNSSALVIHHKFINHPINWDEQEATRSIATGFMLSSS